MSVRAPDLYALPAVQALLDDEGIALLPEIGGLAGAHGLMLSAFGPRVPRTPMLDCWTCMRTGPGRLWHGDVRARQDEPLPFVDDSVRVVVLAHALEQVSHPHALLDEVGRVLVGDGLLAVTGFHPASLWTPWLAWKARHGGMPPLSTPTRWQWRLRGMGLQVYAVRRFGGGWPGARQGAERGHVGGGYLLLARKRNNVVTPLTTRRARVAPAATTVSWAQSVRRERA